MLGAIIVIIVLLIAIHFVVDGIRSSPTDIARRERKESRMEVQLDVRRTWDSRRFYRFKKGVNQHGPK